MVFEVLQHDSADRYQALGGIYVESRVPLPKDDKIRLDLELPCSFCHVFPPTVRSLDKR